MISISSIIGQKQGERLANIRYVPVLVLSMILMFMRMIIAARLLDREMFGLYSFGQLIASSFSVIGCFGFYSLLQRNLPVFFAKGHETRGLMLMNQTMLLALIGFILALLIVIFNPFNIPKIFFVVALFTGLAQQCFMVVTLISRSDGRTLRFANENLIRATLVIFITIIVAKISRDAGMVLFAESMVTLAMVFFIYRSATQRLSHPRIHSAKFAFRSLRKTQWCSPLVLFAASILSFLMLNADRWIAGVMLSKEAFALYAFSGILLTIAQSVQAVINASVFTTLARTYATEGLQSTRQRAAWISIRTLLIGIALAIPGYFLFSLFIDIWFPHYIAAKPLIIWFLVVSIFRVSDFWTSFLIIAQRERQLMALHLSTIIICVSLWTTYSHNSSSMEDSINIAALGLIIGLVNYILCAVVSFRVKNT